MGQYPHHRSYRAYHGSAGSRRYLSKGAKWFFTMLLIAAAVLICTAVHLQQYMVYSISGGHMELPNRTASVVQEQEEPLDLSTLIVEDAPHSSSPTQKK